MDKNEEIVRLFARLDDLLARAEHGEVAASAFLSPRELHFARRELARRGALFFDHGGYDGAERRKIYFLPDYMEGVTSNEQLEEYGYSADICAILVRGSGFSALSHRDFMGSLLGLGIERSVIGDIVVTKAEREAVVFCEANMVDFLLDTWVKAGNDKIKTERFCVPSDFTPERSFLPISDTVASPRLDAVVASVCKLSRERARELVENEAVEVDYEMSQRPDKIITAPCVLTARGYGKFRILSVSEQTKKGRYRFAAEKYL